MIQIQTKFLIKKGKIIGFRIGESVKQWKECQWCGHTFLPHHNKQAYCDSICNELHRQLYKSNWMRKRRTQLRNGELVDDYSILNVGTGGLGEHRAKNDTMEHEKIISEFNKLGFNRRRN